MVQVLIPQTTAQHVKVASMETTADTTNSREIDSAGVALVDTSINFTLHLRTFAMRER